MFERFVLIGSVFTEHQHNNNCFNIINNNTNKNNKRRSSTATLSVNSGLEMVLRRNSQKLHERHRQPNVRIGPLLPQ